MSLCCRRYRCAFLTEAEIIQSFPQQQQQKMRLKRKASGFPPFFYIFFINIKVILVAMPPSPVLCAVATCHHCNRRNMHASQPASEFESVYICRRVGSVQAIRFLFFFVSRLKLHTQEFRCVLEARLFSPSLSNEKE